MTTVLHPTGSTATSPVGATYNSVDRVMTITINGDQYTVPVYVAQQLAEAICRASDSRLTAHPVDFDRAACLIHAGRTADLAVA